MSTAKSGQAVRAMVSLPGCWSHGTSCFCLPGAPWGSRAGCSVRPRLPPGPGLVPTHHRSSVRTLASGELVFPLLLGPGVQSATPELPVVSPSRNPWPPVTYFPSPRFCLFQNIL